MCARVHVCAHATCTCTCTHAHAHACFGSARRLVGGGQPRAVGGAALGGAPRDARVVRCTLALVGAPGCIRLQSGRMWLQPGCVEVPPQCTQGCWHAAAHVKGGWSHVDRRTVRSWRSVRPRHSHAPEAPGAMVALHAWDCMGLKPDCMGLQPGMHRVAAWRCGPCRPAARVGPWGCSHSSAATPRSSSAAPPPQPPPWPPPPPPPPWPPPWPPWPPSPPPSPPPSRRSARACGYTSEGYRYSGVP